MTLIKTWASHFQSTARMKGREYQQEGRVKRLAPQAGELIRAEVQGSQVYTVTISGRDAGAAVSCTCAMFQRGVYCKHIWAAILDHQYRPNAISSTPAASAPSTTAPATSVPAVEESVEEPESTPTLGGVEESDQPSLAPPKARKRESTGPKPSSRHEPEWIGRLSLLRSPTLGPEAGAAQLVTAQYQVCYTINPELCTSQGGLVLSVKSREPTQTGWSKPKPFRVAASTIADLADPVDRELCALIVGASPVYGDELAYGVNAGSLYDKFKLPRGSWRFLLQRVAATGRFYLEEPSAEMFPLQWDTQGPWVLWMIADQDDNGLEVGVELRRDGASIAIQDPDVLLGGVDGVIINNGMIAPFDDGGATRWASQFRDGTRFRERLTSIHVPEPDITRFLDSLLQLPQLPEIEFPEGLFKGQRRGEFLPHLELFSHEYHDPTTASAAPKGQLLARAWFGYDLFRVNPSDPGRYVTQRPPRNAKPGTQLPPGQTQPPMAQLPAADAGIVKSEEQAANQETEPNHELDSSPQVDADSESTESEDPQNQIAITARELIRRDTQREVDSLGSLNSMGFRHHPNHIPGEYLLAAKQMPQAIEELLKRNWVITADQRAIRYSSPPRLSITSGVDWFDLHATVSFSTPDGEQVIGLPQLLSAVRDGRRMITLGDGSQGLLPEQWLRQHALLAEFGSVQGDQLRFKTSQAALLDSLLKDQQLLTVDSHFEDVRRRLKQFQGITPLDPSKRLLCTLRPYQREGLGWLAFLRWFGMGGILADDMGLGKTVQILAMLDNLYAEKFDEATGANGTPGKPKGKHAPSLIVVPRSVIFNWVDEAKNFAPHLRVQAYTGAERDELRAAFAHHDVIITSFGLMRRDINELAKQPFEYVVLDEAQAIKNPSSQSAKAARLIQANHRLALTGTPIENHLGDLWSIFEFLNPGMLGSATGFGRLVRGSGPEEEAPETLTVTAPRQTIDAQNTGQITQALRPFILRRTKQQVLHDLPEKTEQTIHCELEPQQRALYEQLRKHYRQSLLGGSPVLPASGASEAPAASHPAGAMMVLEALLRLRQAACHPGLIDPARSDEPSAKMDVLLDRIADLIEEKHKALVFSQFTSLLALVRKRLDERGIVYEYLDGQTRHRRKHVHRFQTDPNCPLFLISLKAGGLGLNLTAADYVFILDPWWNPAVEAQAIDRAHRIGQTRRVFAYRLICQDTVEQRIAELQQKKKKLADAIIGGGQDNLLKALSREDLEQLLS